ncbi:MAG: M48 family metallopeptidase [Rhizobiales bacterium]|nr:M48 family metallopeptidase [Hyphomicrobiales bacterium]
MDQTPARYFDGKSALERPVTIHLDLHALTISGKSISPIRWPLADLRAIDRPIPGMPFRLASKTEPDARLVIANDAFAAELVKLAPQLKGGFTVERLKRSAVFAAIALASVGLLTYLTLVLAPRLIASAMPDSWRNALGIQIESSFTEGMKVCNSPDGRAALDELARRIRENNPDLPAFTLTVYDTPAVNAFALPGGRIAVFSNLIATADTPEEVAGVVAHEIGHVANRHSEAQLVRAVGLQLLLSLASGGSGGNHLGELASVLTILQYSRDAEREADEYAQKTMTSARIDPLGLKHFFEKIQKLDGDSSILGDLGNMLSTHPVTQERIDAIKPLDGPSRPVLTPEDWATLRKICD